MLWKIICNNCYVYEVHSKESVITEKTQKEVLVENTLVFTIGYLK